ncbi:MAG: protein kinase, partial [Actinomycetota bacterium]|nr:protein kinase [Actinomycetota bacterium]
GNQYFIKQFLSPTYPDDHAPGSEQTKAKKRVRCAAFESQHLRVKNALAPLSGLGGNLIVTLDFFREAAKYYKVTERVDIATLDGAAIAALPFVKKLVLMKTVAHSLKILHDVGMVHSDLKPSNVLIKRTEHGYTTKLIDFDSAYFEGEPPPPDEIVGTLNYYSPELVGYVHGAEVAPTALTRSSDVFTLGLIYCEYLTGAPPVFDVHRYRYAGVAARAGEPLRLPPDLDVPESITEQVERMLAANPDERPTVGEVHASLMGLKPVGTPTAPAVTTGPGSGSGALRGKGLRTALARAVPPAPAEAGPARRLLGKLVGRLGDKTA